MLAATDSTSLPISSQESQQETTVYPFPPEEWCDFVFEQAHQDSLALAEELLRRAAAGDFLRGNPWLDTASDCPGGILGGEELLLIADYSSTPTFATDSLVLVNVEYRALGHVSQVSEGLVFHQAPGSFFDRLVVWKTPYGWRIHSPDVELERVLADTVLSRYHFSSSDEALIRHLMDSLRTP
jgi:hypothetical protein